MPRTIKTCTFSSIINFFLKVFYVPTRNGKQPQQNYEKVLEYSGKFSNMSQIYVQKQNLRHYLCKYIPIAWKQ